MVETTTKNYGWVKPEIQGSPSTWGGFLNTDLDSIDALVWANQQGINPVGSGALWFTNTPPLNWLLCNGASLSTTTYATLFAAIGYTYGGSGANFNLPNLMNVFPLGGSIGQTGGEATHTLVAAEMPVHTHAVSDPTHAHNVYDPTHNHGLPQSPHGHGVNDPTHAHGNVWNNFSFGSGAAYGVPGGATPVGGTTSASGTGVSIAAANANISINAAATGVEIYGAATGVTNQNAGGGVAHNNLPPYVGVNFIIRYQ